MNKNFIIEKINIRLREDNSNAYVQPSKDNSSSSSLSSDLAKTMSENPTDDNFVVDMNHYDGNKNNQPIPLDIQAKNSQDAGEKIKNIMKNPNVRNLNNSNGVTANVHIGESFTFTKKQLMEYLKKK